MKRIYLSGNMSPSIDYYFAWCQSFAEQVNDMFSCTMPIETVEYSPQFIVHHDLARLKASDLVVANLNVLDKSHHMTGTVVEIYEAYKQNKPIYSFGASEFISDQATSPWMSQFITKHFETLDDLITFIRFDDTL